MRKNAYLLAKSGADTAANEQRFAKNLPNNWQLPYPSALTRGAGRALPFGGGDFCQICSKFGPFSAVSAPIFAKKYAPAKNIRKEEKRNPMKNEKNTLLGTEEEIGAVAG